MVEVPFIIKSSFNQLRCKKILINIIKKIFVMGSPGSLHLVFSLLPETTVSSIAPSLNDNYCPKFVFSIVGSLRLYIRRFVGSITVDSHWFLYWCWLRLNRNCFKIVCLSSPNHLVLAYLSFVWNRSMNTILCFSATEEDLA